MQNRFYRIQSLYLIKLNFMTKEPIFIDLIINELALFHSRLENYVE